MGRSRGEKSTSGRRINLVDKKLAREEPEADALDTLQRRRQSGQRVAPRRGSTMTRGSVQFAFEPTAERSGAILEGVAMDWDRSRSLSPPLVQDSPTSLEPPSPVRLEVKQESSKLVRRTSKEWKKIKNVVQAGSQLASISNRKMLRQSLIHPKVSTSAVTGQNHPSHCTC